MVGFLPIIAVLGLAATGVGVAAAASSGPKEEIDPQKVKPGTFIKDESTGRVYVIDGLGRKHLIINAEALGNVERDIGIPPKVDIESLKNQDQQGNTTIAKDKIKSVDSEAISKIPEAGAISC